MARATGPKLNVSLARAAGAFTQSMNMLINDDKIQNMDNETMDGLIEFEEALQKFEKLIYSKRNSLFFRAKVIMFDQTDL